MNSIKNAHKALYIDIETVPQQLQYDVLDDETKKLWDKKASFLSKNDESASELYNRAGIYAEFGKIICISVGIIQLINNSNSIRLKSFYGDNETKLLQEFAEMIRTQESKQDVVLCAHNGKEFDFPYIARRMLINGIKLPNALQLAGKKPWELNHIDTMELWRFGDYKNYTSLELLTHVFKIPSPKNDIDGSQVAQVYYQDRDLERIKNYCQNDVIAIIQLMRRYNGEELIPGQNIDIIKD
ncbi:MAG: 3'-5' exonuclease [Bacteroidales bacterium]|nr:3'-5' exonuclease [Bacteroidales bacterium]